MNKKRHIPQHYIEKYRKMKLKELTDYVIKNLEDNGMPVVSVTYSVTTRSRYITALVRDVLVDFRVSDHGSRHHMATVGTPSVIVRRYGSFMAFRQFINQGKKRLHAWCTSGTLPACQTPRPHSSRLGCP